NVRVTDLLPAGLTFVSATPSQGSYSSTTGRWAVGTVAVGAAPTLTLHAKVASPDAQTNTAAVTGADQFDPSTGNNSASVTETPQQADLALAKAVSDPTPNVGETVTFTVTLTNHGPDAATDVAVKDLLPAGLTFVAATPGQGTYDPASGVWAIGTVAPGGLLTLTLQARVVSAAARTNTAAVSAADQFDPNPGNNQASATETPQQADLALAKTVDDPRPNVGDTITYTVTLTNTGPDAASGVAVSDRLPAGLTFVSATPSQGSYDAATGAWAVGGLGNGLTATLLLSALVRSPAAQTNTATVSAADQFDPNTANNTAGVTETPQRADLALAKSVDHAKPNVGDTVTFTLTLTDQGPDPATGVVVADPLPPGLSFVAAAPQQGSYDAAGGLWAVGAVVPGVPLTLTL